MSEPTEPDSAPENEPENEPETAAETAPEVEAADEPTPDLDVADEPNPEVEVADEPAPEAGTAAKNRQPIFIAAALVVALAIGGGLFFIFRGDDDKSVSPENQAKAAVVAMLDGTYKVAAGDVAGCQLLVDNIVLDPAQGDVYGRCVDKTKTTTPPPLKVDSIDVTKVTLDKTAGTGTVDVTVAVTLNNTPDKQSVTLPVRKVDGRWKVDPKA